MRAPEWRGRDGEFSPASPLTPPHSRDGRMRSFNFKPTAEDDFSTDDERPTTKRTTVIFVPTDLSTEAAEAAQAGITLAQQTGGRLVLFHAVHLNVTPYGPANPAWIKAALCQEAITATAPLVKCAEAAGVPATCMVVEGEPASTIIKGAGKAGANLIVLTTRRPGWWRRLWQRRIVERVICDAHCPVLVLQREPQGRLELHISGRKKITT